MGKREQLQVILEEILGSDNVYFQPPQSNELSYPCILYSLNAGSTKFANDKPYNIQMGYSVTVIDEDPDSQIPGKVASLPMCTFNRFYTADNLNHTIYNLYY